MKKIKLAQWTWVTTGVTLMPMLLGWWVNDQLPARLAIHFNFAGSPDQYASKPVVLFGLPIFMAVGQLVLMSFYAWTARGKGRLGRMEPILLLIFPVITWVLYPTTIGFALGWSLDIRRIVVALIALIFIAMGNYLPTVSYVQQRAFKWHLKPRSIAKWRKTSRLTGYVLVAGGSLLLISLFFPPIVSLVVLISIIVVMFTLGLFGQVRA